jgi:hypothetical protein
MPFKPYKTRDEIPESQRETAIALADGTFGVVEDIDVTPMQAELTEVRRKLDAADKLSKKAAADAAAAELARKAAEQGVTAEALEKIRADVRREVESEYLPKIEAANAAQAELRGLKVDTKVKEIALKHGVRSDRIEQWWRLNGHHFDLTADGKAVVVKGQEGTSVDKHVTTLKTETPEFYVGTLATGGSATGGGTTSASSAGKIDVLKNPSAALAAARESGKTE